MKWLLLLVLAGLCWMWWRHRRVSSRAGDQASGQTPPNPSPQAMVDCPVCGLHLPRADAVAGRLGAYCSEDHRARHEG
jgi:uncharacterized protein